MNRGFRMNLRECGNKDCLRCKDRVERSSHTEDGICNIARSTLDSEPIRCVGDWGQEKAFYLLQYLGIFANGMHRRWAGLNYIEICSGPGRNIHYTTWHEYDGSALAVLLHPTYRHINAALFIDYNSWVVNSLNARIRALGVNNAKAVSVDYQDAGHLCSVLDLLPKGHLNLVFIDPTDLSFPFATLQAISRALPKADLLMTVAIGMDFNRNADKATMLKDSTVRAKYENFLGVAGFFDRLHSKDGRPAMMLTINEIRAAFTAAFREQLAGLGYSHIGEQSIRHYYDLVFASRDPKGLEFWQKACMIEHNGQRRLPLGED